MKYTPTAIAYLVKVQKHYTAPMSCRTHVSERTEEALSYLTAILHPLEELMLP